MYLDDINNLKRWMCETDGYKFGKEIYGRDEATVDTDNYTIGKFHQMQNNFVNWVANLDQEHRLNLAVAINKMGDK